MACALTRLPQWFFLRMYKQRQQHVCHNPHGTTDDPECRIGLAVGWKPRDRIAEQDWEARLWQEVGPDVHVHVSSRLQWFALLVSRKTVHGERAYCCHCQAIEREPLVNTIHRLRRHEKLRDIVHLISTQSEVEQHVAKRVHSITGSRVTIAVALLYLHLEYCPQQDEGEFTLPDDKTEGADKVQQRG